MLNSDSIHSLKRELQGFFSDGLLTIVGSGLSCAEGLPGMGALAERLRSHVPKELGSDEDRETWSHIGKLLDDGAGLEDALQGAEIGTKLEAAIVSITAEFIEAEERIALSSSICGTRTLRLSRLLPYFPTTDSGVAIVTTNYDRLIEASCEACGFHVDTLFAGAYFGRFNPEASRWAACRGFTNARSRARVKAQWAPRVRLCKPHGSLDWYASANGDPIQCSAALDAQRLMITPGRNKYLAGYDQPFDRQREEANKAIDKAQRYLVIGYGFNDLHLQTHLCKEIARGKPTLVLNRSLSPNGEDAMKANRAGISLIDDPDSPGRNTKVLRGDNSDLWAGVTTWDIDGFVSEVLS